MNRIILQVPMSKELKLKAEAVARDQGFSSLQESIRVILTKFSQKKLRVTIDEPREVIHLFPRAERRYTQMDEDFRTGKNVHEANTVDELMKQLNEA